MTERAIPGLLQNLLSKNCLAEEDILTTSDGFFLAYKPISAILAVKQITELPDSQGQSLPCDRFFDDWYLYAVPGEKEAVYSLLKLREQEQDSKEDAPADGDLPGVTISFIAFRQALLLACLEDPTFENRKALSCEINRVVAYRGQRHHKALKAYFKDPKSQGAYLTATVYGRFIASLAREGQLPVPEHYLTIAAQGASGKGKKARLPRFLEALNREAGYVVCDQKTIFIRDRENPSDLEVLAILATHTGNTSLYSFAAEVEYHARFLTPLARVRLPFIGKSPYDSAIRADMTVGDTEFQGPAPFYREDSTIVKRQTALHGQTRF